MHTRIYTLLLTFFAIAGLATRVCAGGPDDGDLSYTPSNEVKAVSRSANASEIIEYTFQLNNESEKELTYNLSIHKPRLLSCEYALDKSSVTVKGKGTYEGVLSVKVSDRIPKGAFEKATLLVTNASEEVVSSFEFITVRSKPHPYLLATDDLLAEAKAKIEKYPWAKRAYQQMEKEALEYKIPKREVVTRPRNTLEWDSFNYQANTSEQVFNKALVWKLSNNGRLRDEVVGFVRDVCDPDEGYMSVGAATTGVQVHEGNFFLYLAAICDVLYGEDILTKDDHEHIAATFRHYIKLQGEDLSGEGIMNHEASALTGSVFAALFLEDMAALDHVMHTEGGLIDQLSKGTMPDGWWFESTVNYSYLVVERFTLVAQAFENYGWNFYDRRFPVRYKSKDFDNAKEGFTGMKFDIWGPMEKNTIGLEEMYTGHIPLMDEEAYVVSSNDSKATGPHTFYELAYRHFPKKEIAWVLNHSDRSGWEALLYGAPEIPDVQDPRSESTFAPNVGITALRSQTPNKEASEQIQAYVKYGTHGGWHGHFDRTGLLALDRYGHKYFGTEMAWFGYGNPGYKESVQTSATHNMVVVDGLQQEAVPSEQLLFHDGEMMQVSVVETNARWRKIPTWNVKNFPPWDDKAYDPGFKPVQQRRLTVVTDDFVVLADHLNASQEHQYDWLIHPIGFQSLRGVKKKGEPLEQLSTANDSPYKYFKNAQWYTMKKGTTARFQEGEMKLDVHTLWPQKADVLIAAYPNAGKHQDIRNNPDRRTYGVRVNGKELYFLTVLEPYKGAAAIKSITSSRPEEVEVVLNDGRKQVIKWSNLEGDGTTIQIEVKEYKNNIQMRSESTN
ncbi:heparinase II/III family protein [Pontibacter sp. E15-1]|uniref:heparinase II/III domain-containing protein n=1 Tax=Pontibacter sp. E15-1 TaxID=2919918 RepID=UPI001F4F4987|nr:heparinase II/III family protein [Pontibacter sp. E15-1]MCJ8165743.1 heparinase II/III family protein [Pontibacter sp. E15-1]